MSDDPPVTEYWGGWVGVLEWLGGIFAVSFSTLAVVFFC